MSNHSLFLDKLPPRSTIIVATESLLSICIAIFALMGNVSMCLAAYEHKILRLPANIPVLNLSVNNITAVVFLFPLITTTLVTGEWKFGDATCQLAAFVAFSLFGCALQTMSLISITRYFATVRPFLYREKFTKKLMVRTCALVWCVSLLYASPALFGWGVYRFSADFGLCLSGLEGGHNLQILLACFLSVNVSVIIWCYVRITKAMKARLRKRRVNVVFALSISAARHSRKLGNGVTREPLETTVADLSVKDTGEGSTRKKCIRSVKRKREESGKGRRETEEQRSHGIEAEEDIKGGRGSEREEKKAKEGPDAADRNDGSRDDIDLNRQPPSTSERNFFMKHFENLTQCGKKNSATNSIIRERKITNTVYVIMILFGLCYLPSTIVSALITARIAIPRIAAMLCTFTIMLTTVVNPSVLWVRNKTFREAVKSILHKC